MAHKASVRLQRTLRVGAAILSLATADMMGAQSASAHQVDIGPQPLASTLTQIGRQTDTEIVFNSNDVRGRQAPAVRGDYSAEQALQTALQGTPLSVRQTPQGAYVIAQERPSRGEARAARAAAQNDIAEIIVTAQKRSENLQDVPISIGVLSGLDLEKAGGRNISDQLNQVGGVNVIENQPGRSQVSIRGASAGGPIGTGSSPVAYYLDEVPFSFITHAIVPDAGAFDLERVEVLKGPQGTLYGSSSLNGVVRILTQDADLEKVEVKGRARAGFTENGDDLYSGDVAINVPLVPDKLAIRGVAGYADYGGYINSATKKNLNGSTSQVYRFKVQAKPVEDLTIKAGVWISRIKNKGPSEAFADYTTPFSDDQAYRYNYEVYNLVLNYDFGPFSVLSSTGRINLRTAGKFEYYNVTPFGPPIVSQFNEHNSKVFAQEVRLTSQFSGPWQMSGGALYRTINELLNQQPTFFPFPEIVKNRSESYALFGEVSRFFMNDKVKLTGGVRYFTDTLTSDQQSAPFTGTVEALLYPQIKSKFDAITWRAVASYYPSDALTLYASAATGFRSGVNQDPTSLVADPTLKAVDADRLMTFEIGAKGRTAGGRLSYEFAGYHQKWKDPQQLLFTPFGTTFLVNAASASGYGLSANATARITRRLSLNASGDWNNLAFDSDVLQPGPIPGTFAVLFPKGGRMNTSPKFTMAVGGDYRVPLGDGDMEAVFGANVRYNSKMVRHDVVAGVSASTHSDDILEGSVRAGVETDSWSANLFVDNVTNERGAVAPAVSIIPTQLRLRPRTIGLQVTFKQ